MNETHNSTQINNFGQKNGWELVRVENMFIYFEYKIKNFNWISQCQREKEFHTLLLLFNYLFYFFYIL